MTITAVKKHATLIKNGNAKIQPGEVFRLNEAASVGDGVWQGDLGIEVVEEIPANYIESQICLQLVPGNTIGSRHVLKDMRSISQFSLPAGWGEESLEGPAFIADEETVIEHPTHGNVIIAAGHIVRCRYQRQYDEEQKRERRAID